MVAPCVEAEICDGRAADQSDRIPECGDYQQARAIWAGERHQAIANRGPEPFASMPRGYSRALTSAESRGLTETPAQKRDEDQREDSEQIHPAPSESRVR